MRKKSHISLARYIVKSTSDINLKKHKISFYFGSILPDLKPSFLYRKHEMAGTFGDVKHAIGKLIDGEKHKVVKKKHKYYLNLGQVTHYVADYFTFPHNKNYPGNLREHCSYEEDLKKKMRRFLKTKDAGLLHAGRIEFHTPEALYDFIERQHANYLTKKLNVEEDIHHIVAMNHHLVEGVLQLFEKAKDHHRMKSS